MLRGVRRALGERRRRRTRTPAEAEAARSVEPVLRQRALVRLQREGQRAPRTDGATAGGTATAG